MEIALLSDEVVVNPMEAIKFLLARAHYQKTWRSLAKVLLI